MDRCARIREDVWRGSASALELPRAAPCAPSPRRRPVRFAPLGEGDAEAPELQGLSSRGIALGSTGETFGKKPNTESAQKIPLELRTKTS